MDFAEMTVYDQVNYPSYTHPQTHPDRLAVIGALFGLNPTPVDRCRVLEVGCGDGTNLVPMAWASPQSTFVGMDLAARPIARAKQMVRELGLTNIRFECRDLSEFRDPEQFDYIIAHGIFSWVPHEVQESLLQLCHSALRPEGIAFVSYNAQPGGHLREMLREMMRFHVRGLESADERVAQAKALVKFLAEAQETQDEYRLWLKAELTRVLEHAAGHLYHDDLAEINEPLYFTQFMERASRHGLNYLGEADYFEMSDHVFSDSVRKTLDRLAQNRWLREQYLDFLKCRRFRQTLLCHQETSLSPAPRAEMIRGFYISSNAKCVTGQEQLQRGVNQVFETAKGAKCQTDFPAGKAALGALGAVWPMPVHFSELVADVTQRLRARGISEDSNTDRSRELADFLLRIYEGGVVEFRTWLPPIARSISERPMTSPLVRWQAKRGDFVTSLFHLAVKMEDEIGKHLLVSLDGTRDSNVLLEELWALIKSRGAFQGTEKAARDELQINLRKNLEKLSRMGLLVA